MDTEQIGSYGAGVTGLALTVGELKAKVVRLNDELARTEAELRAADSNDRGDLDTIDIEQQTAIEDLIARVDALEVELDMDSEPGTEANGEDDAAGEGPEPEILEPETPAMMAKAAPPKLRGSAKMRARREERRTRR